MEEAVPMAEAFPMEEAVPMEGKSRERAMSGMRKRRADSIKIAGFCTTEGEPIHSRIANQKAQAGGIVEAEVGAQRKKGRGSDRE